MSNVKRCVALAAGAVALGSFATGAVEPTQQELQRQINDLQSKVDQLQARQAQDQTAVAATVEQVLRDAERRTQFLAAGGSGAGYDNGFYIRSGDFLLKPGFAFQFRSVTDYRTNTGGAKDDEVESGFEIRRMQLKLEGTAFTKDLKYTIVWNTDRNSGDMFLEDAFVKYMFADDWGFRAGQWKESFFREKIVSDSKLLAIDRSMLDGALGGGYSDRVQGASLIYGGESKNNPLNVELALTDGSNSDNSNYVGHYPSDPAAIPQVGSPSSHNFDFGVNGRAEYKAMGDWKNYGDFSAMGVKEQLLVFGGGFQWNQGGNGDEVSGTLDAQFKDPSGLTLYGAGIVRYINSDLSALGSDQTDWGLQFQISYLINPAWEPFLRYSYLKYDSGIAGAGGEDNFHEITAGVAYYLGQNGSAGHHAKVTIDLNWLPNGSPGANTGAGYLGDSAGDNEIALRGQFQLSL